MLYGIEICCDPAVPDGLIYVKDSRGGWHTVTLAMPWTWTDSARRDLVQVGRVSMSMPTLEQLFNGELKKRVADLEAKAVADENNRMAEEMKGDIF